MSSCFQILLSLIFILHSSTGFAFGNSCNHPQTDSVDIRFVSDSVFQKDQFPYFSMVRGDRFDPIEKNGLHFEITRNLQKIAPSSVQLLLQSSNENVVETKGLTLEIHQDQFAVRIQPFDSGYTTITIQCLFGNQKIELSFELAVSNNPPNFDGTWLTGISDASAAIPLDSQYCIIADDEQNQLLVYRYLESGGPLQTIRYSDLLSLPDCEKETCEETDIEAAAFSFASGKIYWFGSMSNGKAPKHKIKGNRDEIFCTTVNTDLNGNYHIEVLKNKPGLRKIICQWGDQSGLNLSAKASEGTDPKDEEGFNLEGAAFSKDNKTLFLAMRAPLISASGKKMALIIPVQNFENWFWNHSPDNELKFGEAILLHLNNKGIRDLVPIDSLGFLIAAGSPGDLINSSIYYWTGTNPVQLKLLADNLTQLNIEALIPQNAATLLHQRKVRVFCDDGKQIYYTDAVESKFLQRSSFKKFRSVYVTW